MKYFDVGFIIPLFEEANPLLELLTLQKIHSFGLRTVYTGKFMDKHVAVIISGCGKIKSAAATQFLIDRFPAQSYIHYGTAGAISNRLKIGDVIIATRIIEHDVIELFPQKNPPPIHKLHPLISKRLPLFNDFSLLQGTILSGDEDVISTKRKFQLNRLYKGLSVDWESAGFALTNKLNNVEGYILRAISDYAYEHTTTEYKNNQQIAVRNIIRLLEKFFTS